jgi:hypothetical protein
MLIKFNSWTFNIIKVRRFASSTFIKFDSFKVWQFNIYKVCQLDSSTLIEFETSIGFCSRAWQLNSF